MPRGSMVGRRVAREPDHLTAFTKSVESSHHDDFLPFRDVAMSTRLLRAPRDPRSAVGRRVTRHADRRRAEQNCGPNPIYAGEESRLLSPYTEYLVLGTTAVERELAHSKLIASRIADSTLDEIRESTNRGWPLGTGRFKDEIEAALARAARPLKRGRPKTDRTAGPATT